MNCYIISGPEEQRKIRTEQLLSKSGVSDIDTTIISPESSIGIEEVREIIHHINIPPYNGDTKAVIVNSAEKMTVPAQNAFLKTLEEPPGYSLIIISVINHDLLLPTILSRCEIIKLKEEMEKEEVTLQILNDIMGIGPGKVILTAGEIAKSREETRNFLGNLVRDLRKCYLSEIKSKYENLTEFGTKDFGVMVRRTNEALKAVDSNVNFRLVLEILLMGLSSMNEVLKRKKC